MEEQQQDQQYNWQAIKTAVGSLAAEEIVNFLIHASTGTLAAPSMAEAAIFGGIAAAAAGANAPKWLRILRDTLPHEELEPFWLLTRRDPGKRSIVDKLLDRHPEEIELEDDEMYEDDEAEENGEDQLHLGANLRPHPNAVFSNRIVILGMPGAGKSNTVAVLAEELGQYDAPLIIFDQKPEYTQLCASPFFINAFRANAENVTPEGAFAFGQRMMKERLQVVLDLTSYQNDDHAAYVMIAIIKGVLAWESQYAVGSRLPVTFFFEEADYWLPQAEQHAHVDRRKGQDGKSLFSQFQQTVFNLINRGRSFGMGTVVCTQRPANIDNRAIALAEWKILLKANMPNDLNVYKGFGLDPDVAKVLGKGEAFVIGPNLEGVYQIRLRESPDEASTPGLENLRRKPVAPSVATSQASGVPTSSAPSIPTSERRAQLHLVNASEAAQIAERSGDEADEVDEVAAITLTEREKEIADMFFTKRMNPGAIAKELTGGKGGDAYTKASIEVADAIRKYVEAQQRGA